MRRERFYPAMRIMDPESLLNSFANEITPFFSDDNFSGFMTNPAKIDLYRKDGKIFAEAELPGINPDDVELHVYADRLTLSAEKKSEVKDEGSDGKKYFRSERSWGKIERVISFPVEADPETAKAAFKNGVLTVEVNEKSQDKAHKKVSITSEA